MSSSISWKSDELFVNRILDELKVPIKHLVTDYRRLKAGDTFLAYAGIDMMHAAISPKRLLQVQMP